MCKIGVSAIANISTKQLKGSVSAELPLPRGVLITLISKENFPEILGIGLTNNSFKLFTTSSEESEL